MESEWKWDKLDPLERHVAELLVQGKSNAAICAKLSLSRARLQDWIKRILIKTGADTKRAAIAILVQERTTMTVLSLLEEAPSDGVMIIQDRLVKFANKRLRDMLGYDLEEVQGMPFVELMAPGSRSTTTKNYDLRMQGEPFSTSYAIRMLCKDGQEKDAVIASAGQIGYCGRPAVLAIVSSTAEK